MAKGKHAAALFEVMSKGRLAGGKSTPTPGAGMPTPKWWFNSKNRGTKTIPPQEPAIQEDEHQDSQPETDELPPEPQVTVTPVISSYAAPETHDPSPSFKPQPVEV